MRKGFTVLFALATTALAACGAQAASLVMPVEEPVRYEAYASRPIAEPWRNQVPDLRVTEKPMGELIAARLGLVNGSAELFGYRVEGAPSDKTMLDGVIDGGGVKLKLTW